MPDSIDVISQYLGPDLVPVGSRRISFSEAWKDPKLHTLAVGAASHALKLQQCEGPRHDLGQVSLVTNLLLDILMEESSGG
jgi:hypothetical protein